MTELTMQHCQSTCIFTSCISFSPTGDLGCCTAEVSAVELVPTETLSKEDATKLLSDIASAPKETEWDKARALLA